MTRRPPAPRTPTLTLADRPVCRTTRQGQAPAPQAATHPCCDDRCPHAARRRRRQLQPGPSLRDSDSGSGRRTPMRFKRPQVRYATPQLRYPAPTAAQAWDKASVGPAYRRRTGGSWPRLASLCRTDGRWWPGLAFRAVHRHPYVIEVELGQVRAVGEAATPYRPSDAQIALPPRPLHRSGAPAVHRPHRGAAELARCLRLHDRQRRCVLNEYACVNDPFARIARSR